jgi:SpoVK/Ycf46/Vps4 family AAA+-type ATPase
MKQTKTHSVDDGVVKVFYLQQKMIPFIKQKAKTKEINFIVSGSRNLYTKEIEIKRPKVNIDLHYNDDFKEVHQIVLKTLRKNKTKGLFLFHGIPGTGKSTYIKSLILQLNKKVIFLSPKIAANLDNMAFTEFLIDNPNIVLVIEDAEDLIISRENNQNSQLSFLLNLTDGLIADSLGIQIIATFNTDLKNIDKALLRKGRLTAIYEFGALHFNKANQLLKHLNIHDFETMQPMILADIFNYNETNFNRKREKSKIGF